MSRGTEASSVVASHSVRASALNARLRTFRSIGRYRLLLAKRLVQWPARALLRPIVPRVSRDPRLVAFGSNWNRFADNPAYLFLHMARTSGLRCVWVSGSRETVDRLTSFGLESVHRWSLAGVRVALRSSWYVYGFNRADVNTLLDDGAVTFNLWHGVGVKRIARSESVSWRS